MPLWLKLSWSLWLIIWAPAYYRYYGAQNFLWFCDISNLLIGMALWSNSRLIFSWQAVSVLLVQIVMTVDILGRLLLGFHPIGGTQYFFKPEIPLFIRLLSCFHFVIPPLLIWAVRRLGYDRRALKLQMAAMFVVLPLCLLVPKHLDINWVYGPFDKPQTLVPSWLYFLACLAGYPLLLYLPSHAILARLFGNPRVPA